MLDRLESLEARYDKLNELLSDPEVINDSKKLREYSKEQSDLQDIITVYREYKDASSQIDDAKNMLEEDLDDEMREMAKMEISELSEQKVELEEKLRILLLPKDPNDDKNVIMEIRGAAGGDEAALFAGDLFRMYSRFAETEGWKIDIMDSSTTGVGGLKEIVFMINGKGSILN
ncbi:peptide chain release factor 1 [Gracilibacillus boraciitolerans JCM 21714]|uniref:Peptide chain release factor 1 n=1 Tax=Gracilibacillus boraciitolerans JCM 21714 TaxID=1298598 RepID=W4VID9_9BACI|nr:peptide chain release factor 1 [Gracilibacillus boraciitolerans JCM 21714]